MQRERAIEIIEAYGADPARWPDGERDEVRVLLASDLPLRRLADETAALDTMLRDWSQAGPNDDEGAARAMADAALAAAERPNRRWLPAGLFGGAAVAAALVAAVLLGPSLTTQTPPVQQAPAQQVATADTASAFDKHIWSMTFTPTPDEESLI